MPKIFVGRSSVHGKGVFAGRNFRRGDKIGTFTGRKTKNKYHKWVIYIPDLDPELEVCIMCDAPLRYVNHADRPNARMTDGLDLVAKKNISKGEEIFFDYEG